MRDGRIEEEPLELILAMSLCQTIDNGAYEYDRQNDSDARDGHYVAVHMFHYRISLIIEFIVLWLERVGCWRTLPARSDHVERNEEHNLCGK